MTVLETEAAAALAAVRDNLRTEALQALRGVLVRPDGTKLTPAEAGLAAEYDDLENGLVVVGDGVVHLAIRRGRDGGPWRVYLVELVDDEWTTVEREPIEDLAELGSFLDARKGA